MTVNSPNKEMSQIPSPVMLCYDESTKVIGFFYDLFCKKDTIQDIDAINLSTSILILPSTPLQIAIAAVYHCCTFIISEKVKEMHQLTTSWLTKR